MVIPIALLLKLVLYFFNFNLRYKCWTLSKLLLQLILLVYIKDFNGLNLTSDFKHTSAGKTA